MRHVVPTTQNGGRNADPALAYDHGSSTLFVLWLHSPYALSSELRFTSLNANRRWSPPVTFDSSAYSFRQNLRIVLTTKAHGTDPNGNEILESEVNVHALWWEESTAGDRARYAMLTIENATVRLPVVSRDLISFLRAEPKQHEVTPGFNQGILRFSSATASPGQDAVDVTFGNTATQGVHRLNLVPAGDARVRIPVVHRERGIAPPARFNLTTEGAVRAIAPSDDRIALYFETGDTVRYLVWRDEKWSSVRSIETDESVTIQTAVEAITRMVSSY